jgi:hypothetical protein
VFAATSDIPAQQSVLTLSAKIGSTEHKKKGDPKAARQGIEIC